MPSSPMLFGTENSVQLDRFRAVPLAEDTLLCKAKQQRSRWSSANLKRTSRMVLAPNRTFSFRRISGGLEIVRARNALPNSTFASIDLLNPCTPLRLLRVTSQVDLPQPR